MKTETVVIGSGISGLTCAALLAGLGREVTVLEADSRPGGAIKRFRRRRTPFDIGFHYTGCLGPDGILSRIWGLAGILPRLSIRPFPQGACEELRFFGSGRQAELYFSYEEARDGLCNRFPDCSSQIGQYMDCIRQVAMTVPFFNYDIPLESFVRGLWRYRRQPLKEFLDSLHIPPELTAALCQPIFLYGVPLSETSLGIHAMVAHAYLSGAYHVEGGGQAIVDAFVERLARLGVEVLTSRRVDRIVQSSGCVKGVVTHDDVIEAQNVIYTGHPCRLPDMVDHSPLRPIYVSRLRELRNTESMFIVFTVLARNQDMAKRLKWRNLYGISLDDSWLLGSRAGRGSSVMATGPNLRDEDGGDRGGLILMRPALWEEVSHFHTGKKGGRRPGYQEWKEREAHRLLNRLCRLWPELDGALEVAATSSPLTFFDELSAPEGTVYGAKHSADQLAPGVRTRIQGLFLSGQSTVMTGVVGASLSALTTVGEMVGFHRIWPRILDMDGMA